jgi:hypothetical protein
MLPSGNDASLALAVWCGKQFLTLGPMSNNKGKEEKTLNTTTSFAIYQNYTKSQCYSRFIK